MKPPARPRVLPAELHESAVGVRLHGATLNLECDRPEFLDYARRHLAHLAGPATEAPDLEVRFRWSEGDWDPAANPFASRGTLGTIGKRMLGNPHELIWLDTLRMPGLKLRFERAAAGFRFEVDYRYEPKVRRGEPVPEYHTKRWFSLMSWLVYYPLLWWLRRSRGWDVVHASALDTEAGGVLIGGLGGVGKTTTCVALLARPGVTLLSENLTLTDGTWMYACYEPIRLDEASLSRFDASLPHLAEMPFPEGLKKKRLFHAHRICERTLPTALFLPEFGDAGAVETLAGELAAEKLGAASRLTRELEDFAAYAAALDLHWPDPSHTAEREEALRALARRTRGFRLVIDRRAGVEPVVDAVLHHAARDPQPVPRE